jgi:hypothetical protein
MGRKRGTQRLIFTISTHLINSYNAIQLPAMSTFVEPSNEIPETLSLSGKPESTADSGQQTVDSRDDSIIASRAPKGDPHQDRKREEGHDRKVELASRPNECQSVYMTYKGTYPKPFSQMVPFEVEIYGDLKKAGDLTPDEMNRLVQSFCACRVSFNMYKRKALVAMIRRGD